MSQRGAAGNALRLAPTADTQSSRDGSPIPLRLDLAHQGPPADLVPALPSALHLADNRRVQSESKPTNGKRVSLDALDHQLLSLLRVNARTSAATLAKQLRVSRGTVANRIARLEASGVIAGYTVQVRSDAESGGIRAWVSIAVEGDRTREVIKRLLGEPAVRSLHDTNGRWDLLAELHAASIAELSEVLERIRKVKGIGNTETSIHLQTFR